VGDAVTIKDVAKRANVSVATVSRALNGHVNVADAVRRRVVSIADELRYTPHHAARSLSSRRTQAVGVVLPELPGDCFSDLVRGIDGVARERGLHLLVSGYHGCAEDQVVALRAMRSRVDGLLVMAPHPGNAACLGEHLLSSLPSVLIDNHPSMTACRTVGVDNHGAARTMVRHLVACGYRRIAFIAGPPDSHDARERQRGYHDGLSEAGLGGHSCVVPGNFDEVSGCRAAGLLLASTPRHEAIFAANDAMALGCLAVLNQRGLRVPLDIALAGFDDIPAARYADPSLTTMRTDLRELGARAMRLLLECTTPMSEPLAAELVVRDSTRCR
jgi:LacI family transcriptional regulator